MRFEKDSGAHLFERAFQITTPLYFYVSMVAKAKDTGDGRSCVVSAP